VIKLSHTVKEAWLSIQLKSTTGPATGLLFPTRTTEYALSKFSSEDRNRFIFQSIVFFAEYWTMEKV
jgi:hypothetical protein